MQHVTIFAVSLTLILNMGPIFSSCHPNANHVSEIWQVVHKCNDANMLSDYRKHVSYNMYAFYLYIVNWKYMYNSHSV